MGFDVSYHPISEPEIREWYFDALDDEAKIDALGARFDIEPLYMDKYRDVLRAGREVTPQDSFDATHAYYIAIMQGLFRDYFYIRGGAFTFVIEEKPEYARYTKSWANILKREVEAKNQIVSNYSGGVYFPVDQVKRLLADIENDAQVRADVLEVFGEGTLDVLLKALRYARDNDLGLLEATEVIEPNPLDLDESSCVSNLFHCDLDGPMLYADIARKQIAAALATSNRPEISAKKKGGFFSKLFGKR